MSGYPPPPPPGYPPSGQQPYGYDRAAWKMQREAMKQQARMQRQQIRWQRRAMRRGSLVGPLLLLAIGIVFLLAQMGTFSWAATLSWYGHWWPLVLIGAGLLLLLEWVIDSAIRGNDPARPGRTIGGGVIFLLILLAIVGATSHGAERAIAWKTENFGHGFPLMSIALGDEHDMDDTAQNVIAPNGALLIRNPHGDVTVTGSSEDGQVHVSVHKNIRARSDEEAQSRREKLQPVFSGAEQNLMLDVPTVEGGHDDIVVQVPHNTTLTVNAGRGTVEIQEIHAPVSVTAEKGEVNVSGISGSVNAHINNSDTSFSAHSITGGITLEGHTGDINLSDISGTVSLQGDFFGTTHMERVNGPVNFRARHTQLQAGRIDGEVEIQGGNGNDLQANSLLGPVVLQTEYRNVTLDRVQGSVRVGNRDGSVTITNAPPLGAIEIENHHGSVEVGVPEKAGFIVNATTRNGDIENDFGLNDNENGDTKTLTGTVSGGGPTVHIQNTDGDVTVRKSTVAPLPAAPPAPPKISAAPAPTAAPSPKVAVPARPGKTAPTAKPAAPAKPADDNF